LPRLPRRHRGRRADALHVDDGAHQGIRNRESDRRRQRRHLLDPREAGDDRRGPRLRPRRIDGVCDAAAHLQDRSEARDPDAALRLRVRRLGRALSRRVDDLVPQGRIDRYGARIQELIMILEAKEIRKSFTEGKESFDVLRGIDFGVERGEIVSLEGPSGSGKTTFLSILGCILTPTKGDVLIDGEVANAKKLNDIRKRSLGFVFQQFNLFPSLTALENIEYALNVKGIRGREARLEAERVIEAVGLGDRQAFLPRDLSGGQKQRVAIARALAGKAPI